MTVLLQISDPHFGSQQTPVVEALVALALQQRQPHQRLHAAHKSAAVLQRVFVVQRGSGQRRAHRLGQRGIHGVSPARSK